MGGSVGRARIEVDADVSGAARAINKLRADISSLERAKFSPGSKTAAAADREIGKLNRSIKDLGGTVDKSSNFLNRHSTALNQLAFSAARAGSGFANFLPLIARTTTLLAKHEFGEGGIGGALSSLKAKFSGAGTAAEGLAGAGGKANQAMAGLKGSASAASGAISGTAIAIAGAVAALALLVIGIGFLTIKLGPLGSALIKAKNSISLIFEGAGKDVLDFAEKASIAFGITEQAALRFVGKTGQLFKSFGIGAESAGQLSKGLLIASDVLRSTSTEFIAADDALQAMFDTVAGNIEGLRKFDIFLTEIGLTQVALRNQVKVTGGAFDNFQRTQLASIAAIEQAISRYDQYRNTLDSTQRTAERTRAAFDSIKASIGQGFAPLLSYVSNILLGLVVIFREIVAKIGDFAAANEGLVEGLTKAAAIIRNMQPGLVILGKVLGFVKGKGEDAASGALSFDESLEELRDALNEGVDALNNYKRELTVSELEQLVDAHKRLKEAVRDAARAEREAIKDLGRARQDAARDREKAQQDLADVIDDAGEKEFEAKKKVKDVEKKNFRDIRDAERALKRERLESLRRVDDAERALAEARSKRTDNILDANLSLFEALSAGDALAENRARLELSRAQRPDDIRNAKRRLAEEEFDAKERIALLEEKLHETRLDAIEALKEAERELARTIKENAEDILEARKRLLDVEIDIARTLADSEKALRDARREGRKSIKEAETALERLNFQFNTADLTLAQVLDKLEKMKNALIGINQEAAKSDLLSPGATANPGVGPLAHGGPAIKGHPYLIGERGPELFIPNKTGRVISNDELIRALSQMNSGGGGSYTVVEAASPEATARAIEARMAMRTNN